MNKAITDGLVLMPPPFSAGLALWSREDGIAGQGSWAGQPNAAFVPADQDFGGCLEIQKAATVTKVRCFQQIPFQPGLYLRVTARVKAVSGAFPSVRIAGFAAASNGSNVTTAQQVGPSVTLNSYGTPVTVTAIVGSGFRQGCDMVWGAQPVYGHFGIDLTGPNGGVVRIDDITIEDVTSVFLRTMMDWVDVRDYGARGDGVTDDTAAFLAADAAAGARLLVVSKGTYRIANHLTLNAKVRFEGSLSVPDDRRIVFMRNFDLDTYTDAFGSEAAGFRKALQALFQFNDHVTFDMSGRRVDLTAPIDVAALAGLTSFSNRRSLSNGLLNAVEGPGWSNVTATSVATYATAQPTRLTAVANVANVPVGARVSGTGVGREVYVRSKNVGAGTIELSQPLFGAAGTRTFTFERYQYLLDFSGFDTLQRFELDSLEFGCNGNASGVMLARDGLIFQIENCVFNRPKDRGITSTGLGCAGLFVDKCQFWSNEQPIPAQNRTTIALNINANDAKIRDNRVVRFAHFAVIAGAGHIVNGNHFFQGDDQTPGARRAGMIFTATHARTTFNANYVDNCFLEFSNEHDAVPQFDTGFSFSGVTIADNIFFATNVGTSFRWLVVTPRGAGHFLNGLTVTGNTFRTVNGAIDRVEGVDTSFADLDYGRFRNVVFLGNTYHGITAQTASPVTFQHNQASAAETWVVDGGGFMPFRSWARNVVSVVPDGFVTNSANVAQYAAPASFPEQGATRSLVNLRWPTAVRGRVNVTLRCDNPV
ncbi:MAG: hypothetical protein RIR62_1634 [Pseudomonadota bacterium]|jgi:hypothetical protein